MNYRLFEQRPQAMLVGFLTLRTEENNCAIRSKDAAIRHAVTNDSRLLLVGNGATCLDLAFAILTERVQNSPTEYYLYPEIGDARPRIQFSLGVAARDRYCLHMCLPFSDNSRPSLSDDHPMLAINHFLVGRSRGCEIIIEINEDAIHRQIQFKDYELKQDYKSRKEEYPTMTLAEIAAEAYEKAASASRPQTIGKRTKRAKSKSKSGPKPELNATQAEEDAAVLEDEPSSVLAVFEAPGDIITQPGTKIVFNAPYDDKHTHIIKVVNAGGRRIGWAFKTTNVKRPRPQGVAVSCDAFAYGQEDTNNDRVTIEWTNTPEGAAKQFRREWLQGDGTIRRKNLPIEYNP